MLDKDKLILIFYVGVKNVDKGDFSSFLYNLYLKLREDFDDSVHIVVIPVFDQLNTKVEAINPKVISEEDFTKVDEIIKKAEERITEVVNKKIIEDYAEE